MRMPNLRNKKRSLVLNNCGQIAVEYILIAAILTIMATFVAREIRQREVLASLMSRPWARLAGMIENGIWEEPKKSKPVHPNYLIRHISLKGDEVPK